MAQVATQKQRGSRRPRVVVSASVGSADIADLVALENRSFGSFYSPHRYDAEGFQYYLANPNTISFVTRIDGALTGYILGTVGSGSRSHIARINSIAVDKPHRRQGVGRRLTIAFTSAARRRGCRFVHTEVAASRNPGRSLFTELGFKLYRRLPDYYGEGIDGLRLRLSLEH